MRISLGGKVTNSVVFLFLVILSIYQPIVAVLLSSLFLLTGLVVLRKVNIFTHFILVSISVVIVFNLSDIKGAVFSLALLLIYIMYEIIKKENIVISKWLILFIGWVIYASIQFFWIEQTSKTIGHYQTLIFGTLIISLVSTIINNESKLNMLFKGYGFILVVSSMLAWYESLTGNYVNSAGVVHHNLEGIATVGFFNPNDYSMLLIVSMPIMLYWIKEYGFNYKVMAWFVLVTTFYVAYVNETRSVILIYIVLLVIFLFEVLKKKGLLFFLAILMTGAILSLFYKDIISESLSSVLEIDGEDASLNVRVSLLQSALDIFKANIFGVGSGNAELYMSRVGNVHNLWIELLVNYGLFLFIVLILFFGVNIYKMFKGRKQNKYIPPVLLSVLIFIPSATISSSAFQFNIFWFIMALMICVNKISITHRDRCGSD